MFILFIQALIPTPIIIMDPFVCYTERKEGHLCLPLVDIDGILLRLTNTIHK